MELNNTETRRQESPDQESLRDVSWFHHSNLGMLALSTAAGSAAGIAMKVVAAKAIVATVGLAAATLAVPVMLPLVASAGVVGGLAAIAYGSSETEERLAIEGLQRTVEDWARSSLGLEGFQFPFLVSNTLLSCNK